MTGIAGRGVRSGSQDRSKYQEDPAYDTASRSLNGKVDLLSTLCQLLYLYISILFDKSSFKTD